MSKFKVGDRVCWNNDTEGILAECTNKEYAFLFEHCAEGYGSNWDEYLPKNHKHQATGRYWTILEGEIEKLRLVKENQLTNKTIMNLITTFKNMTRSEPNKTFVKAGVMNEDLTLTNEGNELFIQFMFDKHADEFKTDVVDKILAEQEKK